MSEQTRIEITGNIQVHHPIRQAEATVIQFADWTKVLDVIEAESPRREAA